MTAEFADRFLTLQDGLKLHYRDYPGAPDRPPLLCLHGLTRNARDFADFAERHSPGRRVIVPEFRGRGESDYDPVPARYTPLTYAADVVQLLDHLGLERAVFVGTSLGGLVTMTTAITAPHRIVASILNDVGPELGQKGLDRLDTYVGKDLRFSTWCEAADAIASIQASAFPNRGHEEWIAAARRYCCDDQGEIRFDYDMAIIEPFKAAPRPKIDLWPLFLALAQKPLLVVRGELSELLTVETFRKMMEAAPQARFVTVPNIGHAPELDEPEAAAGIDDFLDSVAALKRAAPAEPPFDVQARS